MDQDERQRVVRDLRQAVRRLSQRGLIRSSQWAAELLCSMRKKGGIDDVMEASTASSGSSPSRPWDESVVGSSDEEDLLLLAKAYFDGREYRRCAHVLEDRIDDAQASPFLVFLWAYASYISVEKRQTDEQRDHRTALEAKTREFCQLRGQLERRHAKYPLDGFGCYVLGLVYKGLDQIDAARDILIEAASKEPFHWGSWLELADLSTGHRNSAVDRVARSHWMGAFFSAYIEVLNQDYERARASYQMLQELFPRSLYIDSQLAQIAYNERDFDDAQTVFESIRQRDPLRLDGMDSYSNILYVKEKRAELSELAHACSKIDRYRPETCCVIGNYYSLRSQHEMAVVYFQRALKLNRRYLSAWTLMGHEYVEMKNTGAAVEAYRQAVDIDPTDYRAWYGLGQTYELLNMPLYTLYYYKKAVALRPMDSRMWCAVGHCYEELKRLQDAVKCYTRARSCDERDGTALSRLAKLYSTLGDIDRAAECYSANLRRMDEDKIEDSECASALAFLAKFHAGRDELDQAETCCNRLLDFPGPEKHQAKTLLRDLHSRRRARSISSDDI